MPHAVGWLVIEDLVDGAGAAADGAPMLAGGALPDGFWTTLLAVCAFVVEQRDDPLARAGVLARQATALNADAASRAAAGSP